MVRAAGDEQGETTLKEAIQTCLVKEADNLSDVFLVRVGTGSFLYVCLYINETQCIYA